MTVTECPECEGSGTTNGVTECDFPGAFMDENGRHMIEVEALDDDPDDEDDDEVEVPVESGPEAGGMTPVPALDPRIEHVIQSSSGVAAYDLRENLTWPDDIIGVVTVGDDNGLAHIATRSLGGVEGPFTQQMSDLVAQWQREVGLEDEPEGVIVGKTWAMVLPVLKVGSTGQAVRWLCKALEVPVKHELDQGLMAEAIMAANPAAMDTIPPDAEVPKWIAEYEFDMVDWVQVL